jgi:DNA-binding transcriptional regulator YiaG
MTLHELEALVAARTGMPDPDECRVIRKEAGVSARELGRLIGVSGEAVCLWERGVRRPSSRHVRQYAEALRIMQAATG